ncbi:hypothetical protein SPI_07845 [Niveomyces insectorum RCEF 264]|uniref:Uncharacterized protein n=1 Tax=Niveomyces insectorum RCEF 264 TaxID=1081102 RepID=A0A167P2Y3_9HYPO|nr:hypothetical protein SPI_07845 [Niveomyces insectorum RCEF 264]
MTVRRRRPALTPAAVTAKALGLLVLLHAPRTARAVFVNDFSGYPAGSRSCLSDAADASACAGDDAKSMNACLCSNSGNFVLASAACIGASGDAGDLATVYSTMSGACAFTDTPLTITQDQFVNVGDHASASATSPPVPTATKSNPTPHKTPEPSPVPTGTNSSPPESTVTKTATRTPSKTTVTTVVGGQTVTRTSTAAQPDETGGDDKKDDGGSSGLSSGARAGIIAGACVLGIALLASLAFALWRCRRRRQNTEENRPMLVHDNKFGGGDGAGANNASSVGLAAAGAHPDWKAANVDPDGNPLASTEPYLTGWATTGHQPPTAYSPGVYELAAREQPAMPVEMPGDAAYNPQAQHYAHVQIHRHPPPQPPPLTSLPPPGAPTAPHGWSTTSYQ